MPGDALMSLAQFAGQVVAMAATTDVWESVRDRFAKLLGRGDVRRTEAAEGWLALTRNQLTEAGYGAAEQVSRVAERWTDRFSDLLDEDPSAAAELRALAEDVMVRLPANAVSASGYSTAAGRDINITASRGGTAVGVIHGNVMPPNPYWAEPGTSGAGFGRQSPNFNQGPESVAAAMGGTAVGRLVQERRPEAPGKPVRLAQRPTILVGRESLLADLAGRLAPVPGRPGPRVVTLCGLGGAGKTSVAVEFAYRHLGEVGVCWQFQAEDPAVLAAQFSMLAAQLAARNIADARDPVAAVHAVLACASAGWLVVFDNVADLEAVEQFLPPAGPGRVLLTSQNQHWPAGWAVPVPVLDPKVAAQFLTARTGPADEDAAALDLARELGGLPLALEQAAAYMLATDTALSRYLTLFRARQADLLARGEAPGHREHVAATLGLALSRLEADDPAAAGLLRLLAFLAPEPVPLGLLQARQNPSVQLTTEGAAALDPLPGDDIAARDAVGALRRYSLVTLGDGRVQVHRLVQVVTRAQLNAQEVGQWRQAATALIATSVPADPRNAAEWPVYAVLLPHVRAVLALDTVGMQQMARYLGFSGSYPAARDLYELIVAALAKNNSYGPEHPYTLNARHSLAGWIGEAGDPAGARDHLSALLPITERVLGESHRGSQATRHELARWTGAAGDSAGARDQFAALVSIAERFWGIEHPDTLTTRHELARWTGAAGDSAGARDQFATLLPIRRRILGPRHLDTLMTRHELAYWTGEAGDVAEACDQLAALLPIRAMVQGEDHPSTLRTRAILAQYAGRRGDAAAARDQYSALLSTYMRVLGEKHPDTLYARWELAQWTGIAGDWLGARRQYAALVPITEQVFGTDHYDTLNVRAHLAHWTGIAGDPADARDRLTALVSVAERVLGANHHGTHGLRASLAFWIEEVGGMN